MGPNKDRGRHRFATEQAQSAAAGQGAQVVEAWPLLGCPCPACLLRGTPARRDSRWPHTYPHLCLLLCASLCSPLSALSIPLPIKGRLSTSMFLHRVQQTTSGIRLEAVLGTTQGQVPGLSASSTTLFFFQWVAVVGCLSVQALDHGG